jgi:hypothetical protein
MSLRPRRGTVTPVIAVPPLVPESALVVALFTGLRPQSAVNPRFARPSQRPIYLCFADILFSFSSKASYPIESYNSRRVCII